MSEREHWESVYAGKGPADVSWYRPHLERSLRFIEETGLPRTAAILDVGGGASTLVDDVLARWGSVLDRLARDPMSLDRELDWVIKRRLIETYMDKHGLEWSDSRVAMIDLQYHDVRPGKGLFYKLEESDAVERLVTDDEISKAIYDPPKDTRAYFRGMCLQKYSDEVVSASWDSVIFDLKEGPLKKIFMLEPLRGTEAHVRQLFAESPTAGDLLRNLGKPGGDC